jgi:hypothetical protein
VGQVASVAVAHPFVTVHVASLLPVRQTVPPLGQSEGGVTAQTHAALGAVPEHTWPVGHDAVEVTTVQPLEFVPHVTSCPLALHDPHSVGAGGQEQEAFGWLYWHGFSVGHVVVVAERHPLGVLAVHVARVALERQTVPALGQSAGAGGQVHAADGNVPVQSWSSGQVTVDTVVRHPLVGSVPHVARTLPGLHTFPAPVQSEGGCKQTQAAFGAVPLHVLPVTQASVAVTLRQPSASRAHVTSWPLLLHMLPAPAEHSAGGVGHLQSAFGAVPPQGLPGGHVIVDRMTVQPFASGPQVTSSVALLQALPEPALHSAGGAAHEGQVAVGWLPVQALAPGHAWTESLMQPLASRAHVTSMPPRHTVPALGQSLGAMGHVQAAFGWAPIQGLSGGHAIVVSVRQPFGSSAHATTVLDRQTLPAVGQSAGPCGHVQAAYGAEPLQTLPAAHIVVAVIARQPLASGPQVMTLPVPEQTFPVAPMHSDGGGGHVHWALGKSPVQVLPVGHASVLVTARHPFESVPQVMIIPVPMHTVPAREHAAGGAPQPEQDAVG